MGGDNATEAFNRTRATCLVAMQASLQARDSALLNGFTLEAKLHDVAVSLQWIALGMDANSYNVLGLLASVYNLHHNHLNRALNDAQCFLDSAGPQLLEAKRAAVKPHG